MILPIDEVWSIERTIVSRIMADALMVNKRPHPLTELFRYHANERNRCKIDKIDRLLRAIGELGSAAIGWQLRSYDTHRTR